MWLLKRGLSYAIRRGLEVVVPALAFLSIFHCAVYVIELSM